MWEARRLVVMTRIKPRSVLTAVSPLPFLQMSFPLTWCEINLICLVLRCSVFVSERENQNGVSQAMNRLTSHQWALHYSPLPSLPSHRLHHTARHYPPLPYGNVVMSCMLWPQHVVLSTQQQLYLTSKTSEQFRRARHGFNWRSAGPNPRPHSHPRPAPWLGPKRCDLSLWDCTAGGSSTG